MILNHYELREGDKIIRIWVTDDEPEFEVERPETAMARERREKQHALNLAQIARRREELCKESQDAKEVTE